MAGQKGRDVLLKIADASGGFITVAGIRANRIQLSAGTVDATNADSPEAWRELIAGAGIKTARVTGRGVFKDAASDTHINAAFFNGEAPDWQLVVPGFGTLSGPFHISELVYSGEHDGEAEFSVAIESAGAISFGAMP